MRNCSFGGDRVAVLLKDGRICVKDRQSKGNTEILPACGAICLTLNENGEILAIGTESGAILIQQMNTGKKQILSNLDSRVTAVAFIGNELYSAQEGVVYKWNEFKDADSIFKAENKKSEVTQIFPFADGVATASRRLKLFNKLNEEECEWPGHPNLTEAVATNDKFIVSYGKDEKSVAVWKMGQDQAECRFQLTRHARSLCLKDKSVLVVNESSGSGHQLEIFTIAKKGKPIKAKKSLNISDESGESIEIFAARFGDEKADVVYGVDSNLVWEEIAIEGHENLERTVCQTSKNRKGSKSAKTDVEEVKPSKRATAENTTRRKRGESINETDMSMAERLGISKKEDLTAPKAGSVTMVLQQALHARDDQQLTQLFRYKDPKLIRETVRGVPAQMAPVLVEEVSRRLQTDPEKALASARWLRASLEYHSGPLAAISKDVLESTRIPLQIRSQTFCQLTKLQGKLELAIANANISDEEEELDGPLLTENDLTDFDDASHSESDWEPEFKPDGGASESGAESEIESKRRKMEV